ncbi:unnamed protein product [Pieris macdunnoughi]|uniref:Uncharacterized protein n=1 Tax=Pieris macdunnoughi TaxID=345717 RepID=A0A821L4T2_9NEOP|nr:unnamed protein product [Pieris macdunnoughi]
MENKPKLEPLRLAEWAQNAAFFAKAIELISETKRSKQSDTESNPKVRLNPIPPSQLHLSFQALKPSGIGQTPATNTRITLIEKATPQFQTFKTPKVKKEGSVLNNEIKLSGIKRILITQIR